MCFKYIKRTYNKHEERKMEQITFVSYLRQSTKKQSLSGLGIEAQREIIQKHLGQIQPIAEFVETESGKKTDRPKLAEALELCRKTKSTLIVAKLDRLSRNVAFTSKLLESDVEIKFCDFPEANRLVLHIIASIAEYEAGLISTRTKLALKAKKARGVVLGKPENLVNNLGKAISKSSFTNRQKALDNDNNRRAIAMLKVMATQNLSLSEMARRLNEEGFVTSQGKQFTAWQVSVLLERYNLK
jgi:DNA invertase Pin-like site-specific DNA recombinase